MKLTTAPSRIAVVAVVLMLGLSGCADATETPSASADPETAADTLTMTDAWVKASESGMTGAFGLVENSGTDDVTIVSAETTAASMIELHETVANDAGDMVMQEKQGGFVVPAGGSIALAPGANHMMLMGLTGPLAAGEENTFTLTLDDGSSFEFTAPVKDYSGANETYEGDTEMDMDTDNQ
ncbi:MULTISPECIES: copper chaperone PCu(A)C [Cryobacterium]|uniref:Copper chaperone PCu(A)C n=1 Tax=Cryobacterium breve TaxID=1259258 RepID=A0ABY2IV82_9MICO|nr:MULTISPECIES: copper chaperone PCu(A)C [Cryobacterium]TFC94844.1 copper chaperone PCu(A)C [Cryobacterium breve]TFC94974.1 copper chaperone PCu(A)C [Cryobacterium sp. TmT3-12]